MTSDWEMQRERGILDTATVPGKIDDSALSLEHVFVPVTPIMFKEGIGEINETRLTRLRWV